MMQHTLNSGLALVLLVGYCMTQGTEAGFTKFYIPHVQNSARQFLPAPAGRLMYSHLPRWTSVVPRMPGKRSGGQNIAYNPAAMMGKSGPAIDKCSSHQECRQRLLLYFNRIVKMKANG